MFGWINKNEQKRKNNANIGVEVENHHRQFSKMSHNALLPLSAVKVCPSNNGGKPYLEQKGRLWLLEKGKKIKLESWKVREKRKFEEEERRKKTK